MFSGQVGRRATEKDVVGTGCDVAKTQHIISRVSDEFVHSQPTNELCTKPIESKNKSIAAAYMYTRLCTYCINLVHRIYRCTHPCVHPSQAHTYMGEQRSQKATHAVAEARVEIIKQDFRDVGGGIACVTNGCTDMRTCVLNIKNEDGNVNVALVCCAY